MAYVNNLEKITKFALDLFFPVFCVGCQREGRYLCERCSEFISEAPLVCPACTHSSFRGDTHELCKGRSSLDGLIGVWEYEGVAKKLVENIKKQGITHAFKDIVLQAFIPVAQDPERFSRFLSFLFQEALVLTYVPQTIRNEKRRGFNHAICIAREMARITKKEVQPLLKKVQDTVRQSELEPAHRFMGQKGSFAWNGDLKAAPNVLLVDDAWVTGTTLEECARVLKNGGVQKVWGFTLARSV